MAHDPWRLPGTSDLIVRAVAGEKSSQDLLAITWSRALPAILPSCYGSAKTHADDIAQIVIYKMLSNIRRFRPQSLPEVDFGKWMQIVARNATRQYFAKLNPKQHAKFLLRISHSITFADGSTPSTKAQKKEIWRMMRRYLTNDALLIMQLHYGDGLTLEAIAEQDASKWKSADALRARHKRIIDRLRDRLQNGSSF